MSFILMGIESPLERVGLNKQEVNVYLSSLKLGIAKASQIAQKAKIKREAVYYVLKLLHEKGFISEVIKSGIRYYSTVPPKRILELIEEEKREKTESIKSILNELEGFQQTALASPKVEFYEGVEGFKTVASILLREKNQTIYCYVPESILHFLPSFHPQFRRKRKEKKVFLKLITERTKAMEEAKKLDKEELRETRFNDKIIKNVDVAYYILSEGIIVLKGNEKEQLGVYIKERGIAKLHKNIFEGIWSISKP